MPLIITDSNGQNWLITVDTNGLLTTTATAAGATFIPPSSGLWAQTTTAQNIMDACSQDIRKILSSSTTPDSTILLDYVNRVSLQMLRASRFAFLQSAPQRFVTQKGQTDYWIGPAGNAPAGVYDTGLNLGDLRIVKDGTVFDRSNFHSLSKIAEAPNFAKLATADAQSRMGRPAEWRQASDTPSVFNIYPAPDNQNTVTPMPETPSCTTTTSGALANRIYYVTVTFVDSQGNESTAPQSAKVWVPANKVLVVNPPVMPLATGATGIKYNTYKIYASTTSGSECVQNGGTAVATSSTWQEPNTGLVTGTATPPTTNAVEPIDGYIIEFRYYRQRTQITGASQVLQIPDDYKDIVIAGVNSLAFAYLKEPTEASAWGQIYGNGIREIVRDLNRERTDDYVRPDATSIGQRLPAVESIDLSVLIS